MPEIKKSYLWKCWHEWRKDGYTTMADNILDLITGKTDSFTITIID